MNVCCFANIQSSNPKDRMTCENNSNLAHFNKLYMYMDATKT